jgi:hypothetical protein
MRGNRKGRQRFSLSESRKRRRNPPLGTLEPRCTLCYPAFTMRLRCLLPFLAAALLHAEETQVLIYGGTPAGIAAAIAAARDGERVLLVEPTGRLGGLVTSGLSHTDFHSFESLTGAFLEFSKRIEKHYIDAYGPDSPQAQGNFRGTHAEPKVNLEVLEKLIAEHPGIRVWKNRRLFNVRTSAEENSRSIGMAAFLDEENRTITVSADIFIDATYEGDLMAAARVPFRVGREGRAEFSESLAPDKPDTQLQGYNFRLIMTQVPENRVLPSAPEGFRREDFTGILPLLDGKTIDRIFGEKTTQIYKAHTPQLPNGKHDINDMSRGPVRLSLPGENDAWPDGGGGAAVRNGAAGEAHPEVPFSATALAQARRKIFDEHLLWNVGLLYFLQNDEAVPAKFRDEARTWGFCRDEFIETGHLPPQLYVREARRMEGVKVFTENDTAHARNDARAVLQTDSIAMGDYGPNCHGTAREGTRFKGKHTGEFYKPVPPYQIPFGVIVPRDVENLLVPVAVSASHVGFCALRLEPIWMSLGQAAGHAAHLARRHGRPVQRISIPSLQTRLHEQGSATIYLTDVLPGHPDFAAAQWWGTQGGFHGLHPMPPEPGQRGKQILGQYYEANPGHTVELDRPLDSVLHQRWSALAASLDLDAGSLPKADGHITRGDFIRAAAKLQK